MKRSSLPNLTRGWPVFLLVAALFIAACSVAACGGAIPAPAAPAAPDASAATPAATPAATSEPETSAAPAADSAAMPADPAARQDMYDAAPPMTIDPSKYYYATIKTDKGDMKVQLFADRAPNTVNNFVFLAQQGFYDNTSFHRVIDGFMAQAGDPTGTGMGGPGYQFEDEFYPGLDFDRSGLLAMANSGPGTNGSQFFITFAPTDWLNGKHTIFGEVIEGKEVLDAITRRDPESATTPGDLIQSITIEETDSSVLPTPTAQPPTPTPLPTPTPFPPTSLSADERPLATLPGTEKANYFNAPPAMTIDPAKTYTATVQTSQGDLTVALHADLAPEAVNNFVVLANLGFYDNTPVNDVSPGQLVVLGAPDNDAQNDAGYLFEPETNLTVTLDAGSISYRAVQPAPDGGVLASSSQLFVALSAPPADANANYSFFGQVVAGQDVLASLTVSDTVTAVTITESE